MKKLITMCFVVLTMSMANVGQANTYNISICQGQSTNIGQVWPGAYDYSWNTVPVQHTATITTNGVQPVYIVRMFDNLYNVIHSDTFNITVNPLPTPVIIPASGITGVCPGDLAFLAGSMGLNYVWSTGSTGPMILVPAGTYSVTASDINGCTGSASYTLMAWPSPQIYSINTSTPYICQGGGGIVPLSGSEVNVKYELLLSGSPTGTSLIGTGSPMSFTNITTPGSYTVRATNLATLCQSMMTGVVNLTILAPTGNAGPISGLTDICVGTGNQSYSIAPIPGAVGYVWNVGNGNTISGQGTTTITVNWLGNGSLSVYGQNYCGAGSSTTIPIQFHLTPTVNITPNNPHICAGVSVLFTATGTATTFNWSGPSGLGNGNTYSTTQTGIVSVIGTSQFGCLSQPATTTVYVEPNPTITGIGPTNAICQGSLLQLTASANPTSSYSWTGPSGFASSLQNPSISNATTNNSGNYSVTTTTLYGCVATATINVTVNPTPIISCSAVSPICTGETIHLLVAHNGSYVQWTGPAGFTSSVQNPSITNATTTMTGWYKVTAYLGNCSAKDSVWIQVNAAPNMSASANPTIVCAGQPVTLTATGAATYSWSTGQVGSQITVYPAQTTTYVVTGSNGNGCTASYSVTVTTNGNNLQSIFSSYGMVSCYGGTNGWANISVQNGNYPYSYNWSPNPQNGQGNNAVSGLHAGVYNVLITDANGCHGTNSVTITEPAPIVITPIVNGQTVTALVTGGSLLPGDSYQYNWMPYPDFGQGNSTATFAAGISVVTLTVTDGNLCQQSLVIHFTTGIEDISAANINIYPNPVSDLLHLETGDIKITKTEIYDVTGKLVFTSTGKEKILYLNVFVPGMYMLILTTDEGHTYHSKIIKQ
ncbi:MAG: T9SS type A sorting domain-containing protein [candidate division SR1 bacterium]|nr:T9SS type A sorting domain-containing protein [candidate division SR1 bacterium]